MYKKLIIFSTIILMQANIFSNDVQTDLCNAIKSIDPDASREDYVQLFNKLCNGKMTICGCITKINELEIAKAKVSLEKEWKISSKHWQDIEKFIQGEAKKQATSGKVSVETQLNLTASFKNDVISLLKEAGYKNGPVGLSYAERQIHSPQAILTGDALARREIVAVDNPIDHQNNSLKFDSIRVGNPNIVLGPLFKAYSKEGQRGVLLHEILGHIKHHDAIRGPLLVWSACINNKDFLNKPEKVVESGSFKEYKKATENRADQIPAACHCNSENAQMLEFQLTDLQNVFLDHKKKFGSEPKSDDDHAPLGDRLSMAKRITRLKLVEEDI